MRGAHTPRIISGFEQCLQEGGSDRREAIEDEGADIGKDVGLLKDCFRVEDECRGISWRRGWRWRWGEE